MLCIPAFLCAVFILILVCYTDINLVRGFKIIKGGKIMELLQLPDTGISSVGINIACNSGCTINK